MDPAAAKLHAAADAAADLAVALLDTPLLPKARQLHLEVCAALGDALHGAAGAFRCPDCGLVSHHPKDVEERFCGRCNTFPEDRDRRNGASLGAALPLEMAAVLRELNAALLPITARHGDQRAQLAGGLLAAAATACELIARQDIAGMIAAYGTLQRWRGVYAQLDGGDGFPPGTGSRGRRSRCVIRHRETGLLLRQHWRTGALLGWTRSAAECRRYFTDQAAAWRDKAGLTEAEAEIVPLEDLKDG